MANLLLAILVTKNVKGVLQILLYLPQKEVTVCKMVGKGGVGWVIGHSNEV